MTRELTQPIPQSWYHVAKTVGTTRLFATYPTPRGPAADTLVVEVGPSAAFSWFPGHAPPLRAAAGTANDFWTAGGHLQLSPFFGTTITVARTVNGTLQATAQVTRLPLYAIWAPTSTLMFAAGTDGVLLRWNGSGWERAQSGTTNDLYALHGGSATDLWAAGENGTLLHYTGTAWNAVTSPTTADIRSLWVAPTGEVFLAAGGTVYRGSGGSWQPYAPGGTVTSLQGASASDVVAVVGGRVHRFDGTGWTLLPAYTYALHTGGTADAVIRAAAPTGGNVYAISEEICSGVDNRCYNLVRWNGTSWTFLSRQGGQAGGPAGEVRLVRLRDGSLVYMLQGANPIIVVPAPSPSPSRRR